jgi:predicted DCC family thiol-disulfide oxidoreductase YuxK
MNADLEPRPTTLLYDGDCGLCTAAAAWLGRRVSVRRLRLVALSDVASQPVLRDLVVGRDLTAALHLATPDGRVLTGARAVIAAVRLVPRWRALAILIDHRVGHVLLEPVYRQVARRRRAIGRLLGLPATCPVPTPAERPR